jgi:hypothetical protein
MLRLPPQSKFLFLSHMHICFFEGDGSFSCLLWSTIVIFLKGCNTFVIHICLFKGAKSFYFIIWSTFDFFWKVVHVRWVCQGTLTRKNQCKSYFGLPHPRYLKNVCKVNIAIMKRKKMLKLIPNIEYRKNPCRNTHCNK